MGNVTTTSSAILDSIISGEVPIKQKKYPFTIITEQEYLDSKSPKFILLYFRSDDRLIELDTREEFYHASKNALNDALSYFGCGTMDRHSVHIKIDTRFTNLEKICDAILIRIKLFNTTSKAWMYD